jgi:hypothetical protein
VLFGTKLDQTAFVVYRDALVRRSGLFRTAWTHNNPKPTELKDYDPNIFNHYLHCVNYDVVRAFNEWHEEGLYNETLRVQDYDTALLCYGYLVQLYVIADGLQDPITANMVIDEIRRFSNIQEALPPGPFAVDFAFLHTPKDSGLRSLLADIYVFGSHGIEDEDFPAAFLKLVIGRYKAMKNDNQEVKVAMEKVANDTLWGNDGDV